MITPSLHLSMLWAATFAIAVTLLAALGRPVVSGLRQGWITDDWYDIVAAVLIVGADVLLFVAAVVHRRRFHLLALRYTAATLVILLLLFPVRMWTGGDLPGLWPAVLSGTPAIAFAATTTTRRAVVYLLVVTGAVVVVNACLSGFTAPDFFIANVGNTVAGTFFFVIFTAAAMRLGRIVDDTEARVRASTVRARRLRARAEETGRFTALVHDTVLTHLSAVGKGIRPPGTLELRLVATFDEGSDVPARQLVETAAAAVREVVPDCPVDTVVAPDARPVPAAVASPMVLALSEAARNSAKHAVGAGRTCRLEVTDRRVVFRLTDDGPGFDPAGVRVLAAGIRVSVQGRMDALEGGAAQVSTAPGEGTTVLLAWERDAGEILDAVTGQAPDRSAGASTPGSDGTDGTTAPIAGVLPWNFLGMPVVFSWWYAAVLGVVFFCMLSANTDLKDPVGWGTWVLVMVALCLMTGVEGERLPRWRVVVITGCLCVVVVLGMWQTSVLQRDWLRNWHFAAFTIVAALLVVRGHVRAGLGAAVFGEVAVFVLRESGLAAVLYLTPLRFLTTQVPVAAAVLLYLGFRLFLRRVPEAQRRLRESEAEAAAAQEAALRRTVNLEMLEREVGPVLTSVAAAGEIPAPLAQRAKLTEMALRDMIRSPLLDIPALRESVRDARARGVKVLLLDDRSHSRRNAAGGGTGGTGITAADDTADRAAVDRLLPGFLKVLDAAEAPDAAGAAAAGDAADTADTTDAADTAVTGKVTVRLLPVGRDTFATVTDGHRVLRFAGDGTLL